MEAFCPYRICPLGAHIDHQKGNVCGTAIDLGITIVFESSLSNEIYVTSENYTEECRFLINNDLRKENKWYDYLLGAVKIMREKYNLKYGIIGTINADLLCGGISSSTALTNAFVMALCKANKISISKMELINISYQVEHEFLGLNVGKMDQYCEVMSKEDELLFLDTATEYYQSVKNDKFSQKYKFLLMFSGIERHNTNSEYNTRVSECIFAFDKLKNTNTSIRGIRGIPFYEFESKKSKLTINERKRCIHFYSENERVKNGLKAWRCNDIESFGRLMNESCESSINDYESGSEQLCFLFELSKKINGIIGFRFLGAGFNGYSLILIEKEKQLEITNQLIHGYTLKYPLLANKAKVIPIELKGGIIV